MYKALNKIESILEFNFAIVGWWVILPTLEFCGLHKVWNCIPLNNVLGMYYDRHHRKWSYTQFLLILLFSTLTWKHENFAPLLSL